MNISGKGKDCGKLTNSSSYLKGTAAGEQSITARQDHGCKVDRYGHFSREFGNEKLFVKLPNFLSIFTSIEKYYGHRFAPYLE